MKQIRTFLFCLAVCQWMMLSQQWSLAQVGGLASNASATQKPDPDSIPYGVWTTVDGNESLGVREVMRLKVHPMAAPVPLLRYRLVPDPAERTDGNSAPAYMKAMGFVEQQAARALLSKMEDEFRKNASDEQRSNANYPPYRWFDMAASDLPLDEVKRYLELTSFQEPMLFDAARRQNYSQDRAMENESNPIGYLLPEVQQMRGLARLQTLRARIAVAENRVDDAVEIVGQMLAMANHVSQDEFMVSCMVGIAIEGIAISEGLAMSQHREAPNLYWAIAACPSPMIDVSNAIKTERLFLERQFPILKEVNETARSTGFWRDFIKRWLLQWNKYAATLGEWGQNVTLPGEIDSLQFAAVIAAQHEPARRFLLECGGMTEEQLEQYAVTQIVFLAMLKYHEIVLDETTVQLYMPFLSHEKVQLSNVRDQWKSKLGWIAEGIDTFALPFATQVRESIARAEQELAMWQTVEAVRMTAASSGGEVPGSVNEFVVPAPQDPASGKPFQYRANRNTVVITGAHIGNRQRQLVVEVVARSKENR